MARTLIWRCEWIWQTYCWVMDDVLCLGAGDHDLIVLLAGLLILAVRIRLKLGKDVVFPTSPS